MDNSNKILKQELKKDVENYLNKVFKQEWKKEIKQEIMPTLKKLVSDEVQKALVQVRGSTLSRALAARRAAERDSTSLPLPMLASLKRRARAGGTEDIERAFS